jgi:hypothetical protein
MSDKKKRMSREEITKRLLETDENFRQLHEIVKERNGGRIPSPEEIDRHIQERRERRASS